MGYFANGTEGEAFESAWCSRCVHSDLGFGKEIGVDPPCPVWMAHLSYAYELCNEERHPGKIILDMLIKPVMVTAPDGIDVPTNQCMMFHPIDAEAKIPGQLTIQDA